MLINTVVMFLQELLPALLLLSTLLVWQGSRLKFLLPVLLGATVFGLLLIASQFSRISDFASGSGLELLYICCYLLTFILLLLSVAFAGQPHWSARLAGLAVASLLWVNGSNLVLFLFVYQQNLFASSALLLGAALGLGIGLSVAVLWYQLQLELAGRWRMFLQLCLSLLAARQISMAVMLLVQTDWLASGPQLWNSEWLLSEESEYGHFFNALLGYEATPGLMQLVGFVAAFLLLLWQSRRLEVEK